MKEKKIPLRKCVGCMVSKPKRELIRIVADKDGNVSMDLTGKAAGRGVYLCNNQECFAQAKKKRAIKRSLEIEISEEKLNALFEELMSDAKKNQ
jgi:predicted RNA-binding protein YlxR (DUF448 family)